MDKKDKSNGELYFYEKEVKKIICDSCEMEFKMIIPENKEISICPFCCSEEIFVISDSQHTDEIDPDFTNFSENLDDEEW